MKKILDKLKSYLRVNNKLFLFLSILLVIGIIAGSIFSVTITDNDTELVNNYLINYLTSIKNGELLFLDSFVSTVLSNLIVVILIWIFGISIIGIPVIFLIFFYKSFILGFTIGSILLNYKIKGILFSIIYVFPHHIINLLMLMIFIVYAYVVSLKIINAVFKRTEVNFKPITYKYLSILGIVLITILLTSFYSSFIVPRLLKLIIPIML